MPEPKKEEVVDNKTSKPDDAPRVPAQLVEAEIEALANEIASDSQLSPDASIHEIIMARARVRQMIVAEAIRGLNATKFYFSKTKGEMVHEPDYATRVKCLAFLASYSDGLPPVTNLNYNVPAKGGKRPAVPMTPAVREAVERMIAQSKKHEQPALPV